MQTQNLIFTLFLGLIFQISFSQSLSVEAFDFLKISPDAKSASLGSLGVASSYDAYGGFYNPSKLGLLESNSNLGVFYMPWLPSLSSNSFLSGVTYHKKSKRGVFGVSLDYFTLGDLQFSSGSGQPLGGDRPTELAVTFNYALKLSDRFFTGIGIKYLYSDFGLSASNNNLNTVNSFAGDFGLYYKSDAIFWSGHQIGFRAGSSIMNIGPKVDLVEGEAAQSLPTLFSVGGGFDYFLGVDTSISIDLQYDLGLTSDFRRISTGATLNLKDWLAVRSGYNQDLDYGVKSDFLNLGLGLSYYGFVFDFSYLYRLDDLSNSASTNNYRISLSKTFF